MANTPVTGATEPAYGAKVQQAGNEQMQQAALSVAASQYPQMFAEGDEYTQSGNTSTQSGNAAPMSATISNPYMMLPAQMNFPMLRQKTPVEQQYDAGLLFQMLGQSSPTLRAVSVELLGNRNGNTR